MKLVGLMHCSHLVVVETVIIKSVSLPLLGSISGTTDHCYPVLQPCISNQPNHTHPSKWK